MSFVRGKRNLMMRITDRSDPLYTRNRKAETFEPHLPGTTGITFIGNFPLQKFRIWTGFIMVSFLWWFSAGKTVFAAGRVEGEIICLDNPHTRSVVLLDPVVKSKPNPPPATHVIIQRGLQFIPSFLVIRKGDYITFPNEDPLYHNVFSPSPARLFNLGVYGPGDSRKIRFTNAGVVHILCHLHPQMHAIVIVVDSLYYQIPDPKHRFFFSSLAEGEYHLSYWTEHCGEKKMIPMTVSNDKVTIIRLQIKDGQPIIEQDLVPESNNPPASSSSGEQNRDLP